MQFTTIALTLLAAGSALASPIEARQSCRDLVCTFTGLLLRPSQFGEWRGLAINQIDSRKSAAGYTWLTEPACAEDNKCTAVASIPKSDKADRPLTGSTYSMGYAQLQYTCTAQATSC